jgi:cytochrome c oxidase cbb3-type subunit 3
VYQQNCATCHGAEGQGLIGPNLTDNAWLQGGKPVDIHKTIAQGSVAKGMPAWERTLGVERVRAVTAYVLTFKGRNVPGKPPQGEPEQ